MTQATIKHVLTKQYYIVMLQIGNPDLAAEAGVPVGWWMLQPVDGSDLIFVSPSQMVTEYEGAKL